jgi:hypothetical protein
MPTVLPVKTPGWQEKKTFSAYFAQRHWHGNPTGISLAAG